MQEVIIATKNWLRMDNNWHLLVEVKSRVFHRTVIIYDTRPGFEDTLETNKRIKEADMIEEIKKECGVRVKLI